MSTPILIDKQAILSKLKANRQHFKNLYVKRLGLFGSFSRGDQSDESDIDLLVEFQDGKKNFDNFMAVSFSLDDLFTQKVELVTLASLSSTMQSHILEDIEYVEIYA